MKPLGPFRYVSVARRRANARQHMAKLRKKGVDVQPVKKIKGLRITRTFWGKAWCKHLESFSDYANRLPRGRTYVRNGSVCHLLVAKGKISGIVSGNELYNVTIAVKPLAKGKWKNIKARCSGQMGTLLELLQGKLSKHVMGVVTARRKGLFPTPREIRLACTCPDWATMCKHVAAVLYGVGARLDEDPALLFLLRGVNQQELISVEAGLPAAGRAGRRKRIADDSLSDVFGIEMAKESRSAKFASTQRKKTTSSRKRKKPGHEGKRKVTHSRRVTGKDVTKLRGMFEMSKAEFAILLRVSATSISHWETRRGVLNLQSRSIDALNSVKGLSKRGAWRKLHGS